MKDSELEGSCLCGKVTCKVKGPFERFMQCFCDRCQKKSGSAFAALIFTTPDKIQWITGEDLVKCYDLPQAQRFRNCFCSECGSQVPYASRDNTYAIVPAGFISGEHNIKPTANIFWLEKPCWFDEDFPAPQFDAYPK